MRQHFYPTSRTQARYELVLMFSLSNHGTLSDRGIGHFRLPSQDFQSNNPLHAKNGRKIWTGASSNFAADDN